MMDKNGMWFLDDRPMSQRSKEEIDAIADQMTDEQIAEYNAWLEAYKKRHAQEQASNN